MSGENDIFIVHLKEEIQKKFGQNIFYAKDCKFLSEVIQESTKRQISISTLKRFFGIIKSPFNPSKFTLDTFSIYLNFKSWQDFINCYESDKQSFSQQNAWEDLKIRAKTLTEYSLNSLKTKIGAHIKGIPVRNFAEKKFVAFLNSPQTATAFIAPGGYGKSTIVTQLAEKYFIKQSDKSSNDIICLIDGGIIYNLISLDFKYKQLANLLEFNPQNSFSNYFRENPEQVKGRFILIVDRLNEIYYQTKKLTHFIDNLVKIISSYEQIDWFKLVITCRPDTWQIFCNFIRNNPHLKSNWFEVTFEGNLTDTINVPPLSQKEIKSVLKKNNYPLSFENLRFHFPEITDIICNPYFLYLFLLRKETGGFLTDIELLNHFALQKILSEPYSVEKRNMIDSIIRNCENGRLKTVVKKDDILQQGNSILAYNELISIGILHEYTIPDYYLTLTTFVKFSHNILFEFFLANKWIKENKLNVDLLKRIIEYYENTPQRRCNILKYIIKIAFKEENTELLKDVYSIFQEKSDSGSSLIPQFHEVINTVGVELRKNKKVRDILIPWYAKSKSGQLFYFESFFDMDCLVLYSGDNIDYYLQYNQSIHAKYYGHFMKFMQYFLACDLKKCEEEYHIVRNLGYSEEINPLYTCLYLCVQIVYQSVFIKKPITDIMNRVYLMSDKLFEKNSQTSSIYPRFEFSIIFALNYGNKFEEIIELASRIADRYDLTKFNSNVFFRLTQTFYARALLNTGKTQQANKIFSRIKFNNIPIHLKHYLELRFQFVQVEFLIFNGKIKKAYKILKEIKTISQMLKFYYFYEKAEMLEKKIIKG